MIGADEEHEGGGAVHHLAGHQRAAAGEAVDAVVPRAGLATDQQRLAIGAGEHALQAPPGAIQHHRRQDVTQGGGDLRGQHLLLRHGLRLKARLPGGAGGKVQTTQALHANALAIVEDDAHQLGQRAGSVPRAAQRGAQ